MSKFINESWLVVVMGLCFGTMLAGAQMTLSPKIEENKKAEVDQAVAEVVPGTVETKTIKIDGFDDGEVFKCLGSGGKLVGWALKGRGGGFIDKITLVAGVNADATEIIGIKVTEHMETPGLGTKIEDPAWSGQYEGKDATKPLEVVKRDVVEGSNEIKAITGATWSSKYVTAIVNQLMTDVRPKLKEHQ